jgi:putative Mn2+ efflux pump MntP
MGWVSLIAIAVALAMDAFAVSIVAGLTLSPLTGRHVFRLAFHFGLFQALMPTIGWLAGVGIHRYIAAYDHWVAFGLLGFVGGRMCREALAPGPDGTPHRDPTRGWELVLLSVATSIDALAVGLSLAMIGWRIAVPAVVIGVVAAGFTATGMLLGRRIGDLWGRRVEGAGGLVLIAIGIKIVVEHLSGGG